MKKNVIFVYYITYEESFDLTTIIKTVEVEYTQESVEYLENCDETEKHFFDDIESLESEYGVHDVGYSPDTDLIGYNTYEVDEDKIEEHFEKYLELVKTIPGVTVIGEINTEVVEEED